MHVAESYVWRYANGDGYVGRHPEGVASMVARRGDALSDSEVKALGLSDLKDRTDYAAVMAAAVEAGAEVTVVREVEETRGTGKDKHTVIRRRVVSVPAKEAS